MEINNANDAKSYVASWGSSPNGGSIYLKLAVEGLEMASSIMESARNRYSNKQIVDAREAIGELRLAYFKITGKAMILK